jgi:hypothetical protein
LQRYKDHIEAKNTDSKEKIPQEEIEKRVKELQTELQNDPQMASQMMSKMS